MMNSAGVMNVAVSLEHMQSPECLNFYLTLRSRIMKD